MSVLLTEKEAYINEVLFFLDEYNTKKIVPDTARNMLVSFKQNKIYHIDKNMYYWCKQFRKLTTFKDMVFIRDAFGALGLNDNFLIKQARNYFDIYVPNIYKKSPSIIQMRHAHLYNKKIAEILKDKKTVVHFIGIANTSKSPSIANEIVYYDNIIAIPSKFSKKQAFFGVYHT